MVFVVFEGIDGGGKTTQIKKLNDYLLKLDKKVVLTREPGGTNFGKTIRETILHSHKIDPISELFLFMADRSNHVKNVIKPALNSGKIVLCDRYCASTYAYQFVADNLEKYMSKQDFNAMEKIATHNIYPDITFLFNIDFDSSSTRLRRKLDNMESRKNKSDFYKKVQNAYIDLSKQNSNWVVLDAKRPIDDIFNTIVSHIVKVI